MSTSLVEPPRRRLDRALRAHTSRSAPSVESAVDCPSNVAIAPPAAAATPPAAAPARAASDEPAPSASFQAGHAGSITVARFRSKPENRRQGEFSGSLQGNLALSGPDA